MSNPIICVDFDGVIHSYKSGWKGVDIIPDDPVEGAIQWLTEHLPVPDELGMGAPYVGPEVQVYSSRSKSSSGIRAMKKWFIKHGLHPSYIKDGVLKFPTQKPAAFLTIDDRAICFNGKFPSSKEMLDFKPWHSLELGSTGKYPDGKISDDDEGELRIAISHDRELVHIRFGKKITWMALPKEEAISLAKLLVLHAEEL